MYKFPHKILCDFLMKRGGPNLYPMKGGTLKILSTPTYHKLNLKIDFLELLQDTISY